MDLLPVIGHLGQNLIFRVSRDYGITFKAKVATTKFFCHHASS
jgi:hypothetical protein